ncbi:hypothetical protein F4777DRAFT_23270 [Nemania sp. FL0916]|nr:hypothetical protein F4777DRAFT_23270 [Nemania sp. FL0916]
MSSKQLSDVVQEQSSEPELSVEQMWAEAAKSFEAICQKSLKRGDIKSFDDVREKIENSKNPAKDNDPPDKWNKAKRVGLESLKWMKLLVGAATQASGFIPLPSSAVSIASNSLLFVFDIPQAIQGYNDAINQVFGEVSSSLSQFKIYMAIESKNKVDPLLIKQIHVVMVSFVNVCAHVINYNQGRKRDRFAQKFRKSVFDEDSGLSDAMAEFKTALQQQRDVEGTVSLSLIVETREDVRKILENQADTNKIAQETYQAVQETQEGVLSLMSNAERTNTLIKIRNTLGVPSTVHLDTKTTQTCTDLYRSCLSGTGSWIWTQYAYTAWTGSEVKDTSHVLLISGPPSSGKTLVSARITKRLEEQNQQRDYVAHYFFRPGTKKSQGQKNPIHWALKYLAFQIARVEQTVLSALGKVCDTDSAAFRSSASLEALWADLKIGGPGSGARYYLVFDGLENLPEKHSSMLLEFLFSPKITSGFAENVRFLVSGTEDTFAKVPATQSALQIQMGEHNQADMRNIIDDALNNRGMLKNAEPGSKQKKARDKIVDKLPQNVKGSYSSLQFALDEIIRMLSTRAAFEDLDRMLDQTTKSHEVAIKQLQQSLTAEEISGLNELLKWVLFSKDTMDLDELEAIMFLYSGTESLTSLRYIIENKYSAVLEIDGTNVFGQDGVKEYLHKRKEKPDGSSQPEERSTISMTITINNVDQELCGHFLWDLAQKAIRDKFRFDFDTASNSLHSNSVAIAVDEFEANHTIVMRTFDYLAAEPTDQTIKIGEYLINWLPYHLNRLIELEDEEKGALLPDEQMDIGRNLYQLFKDEECFKRHRSTFEHTFWTAEEMEDIQKWLMNATVVRKLDKKWRDGVRLAPSLTRGFMKDFVKMVVTGLVRERSWNSANASSWIAEFMKADHRKLISGSFDDDESVTGSPSVASGDSTEINWFHLSSWCKDFLGLPDEALDSIWYERLAASAEFMGAATPVVLTLYKRALERENPSWLCHRGLGEARFNQDRTKDAIAEIERAISDAQLEGATPKAEEEDLVDLHLLLGKYAYAEGDMQKAADNYFLARQSIDTEKAMEGQLGYLKSTLSLPNAEVAREALKKALARDDSGSNIVGVMRMLARNEDQDEIFFKAFSVAEGDPDLMAGIVHAMEMAATTTTTTTSPDMSSDNHFTEDEYRGVLFYYIGSAAYTYKVSAKGTEPVSEALRLWTESREKLAPIGGTNALQVRLRATTALAKHYFENLLSDGNTNDYIALSKLAEEDSGMSYSSAPGYLAVIHALQGNKEESKEILLPSIRQALNMLSDESTANDLHAFYLLFGTLVQYLDFRNAAIALSLLGMGDPVTFILRFEPHNMPEGDGIDEQKVFKAVTTFASDIIHRTDIKVPDRSQHIERIKTAKEHIDWLMNPNGNATVDGDGDATTKELADHSIDPTRADPNIAAAHSLLDRRMNILLTKLGPEMDLRNLPSAWQCDGRDLAGNECKNMSAGGHELYHCIYCVNHDFCRDCLKQVRAANPKVRIPGCSARHRWLRIPPLGADMYVGHKAKSVRVPKDIRAAPEDEMILDIHYEESGHADLTVKEWIDKLAAEWNVSIMELRTDDLANYPDDR